MTVLEQKNIFVLYFYTQQINSIRNEIFSDVPFCESECNAWWNACKDDLTCVENWGGQAEGEGFDWGSGK